MIDLHAENRQLRERLAQIADLSERRRVALELSHNALALLGLLYRLPLLANTLRKLSARQEVDAPRPRIVEIPVHITSAGGGQ